MGKLCVIFSKIKSKEFVFEIDEETKLNNENPLYIQNYEQYDMKDFLVKFLNTENFDFLSQSFLAKFDDFENIKQIQKDMRAAVDYIFKHQPYCNHYYYNFINCFANDSNLVKYTDKLEMITNRKVEFANNNCIEQSCDIYLITSLHILFYIFLKKFMDYGGRPVRACQNCGKYFMVQNRISEKYCNNQYRETGKTCKELSSNIGHKKQTENDLLIKTYLNLIKKKRMRKDRHKNNKTICEFEHWKGIAKIEYEKYKNKEITAEEFGKWLSENDKLVFKGEI